MRFCHLLVLALLAPGIAGTVAAEEKPHPLPGQFNVPASITGNPAADNELPGTGMTGALLHIPEKSGLRVGGVWLGDSNGLLSGGLEPGKWSFNSALIASANIDAEALIGWKGASFGIQFLQFNGQNTNGQAGSVQGYNSLPGPDPLNRSEL